MITEDNQEEQLTEEQAPETEPTITLPEGVEFLPQDENGEVIEGTEQERPDDSEEGIRLDGEGSILPAATFAPQRTEKATRRFQVPLSDEDKESMSHNLSAQTMKIKELDEEKKGEVKIYNKRIKDLKEQNEHLAELLIAGEEEREVAIEITYNKPKPGFKWIVRTDTYDGWEEPMSQYEYTLDRLPENVQDGSNDENEEVSEDEQGSIGQEKTITGDGAGQALPEIDEEE